MSFPLIPLITCWLKWWHAESKIRQNRLQVHSPKVYREFWLVVLNDPIPNFLTACVWLERAIGMIRGWKVPSKNFPTSRSFHLLFPTKRKPLEISTVVGSQHVTSCTSLGVHGLVTGLQCTSNGTVTKQFSVLWKILFKNWKQFLSVAVASPLIQTVS